MLFFVLLAADEWISMLVGIVFLIIYALSHVMSTLKTGPPAPRNQPRRPAEPTLKPVRPQAPTQLNQEIEQFLKRANQRRGERGGRKPAGASTPKAMPKAAPPREAPVDVVPIEQRDFGSVASSVEQHLGSRSFTQRAEHLADDIVRADAQMEQHLQQAFNRKVGTLATTSAATPASPLTDTTPMPTNEASPAAALVAGLLSNPQSLKNAVMLNEILRRPAERW